MRPWGLSSEQMLDASPAPLRPRGSREVIRGADGSSAPNGCRPPGERSESMSNALKRYSRIVKRVRVTSHGGGERAPSFPREVRPGGGGAGATELSIVPSSRQEIE